MDRYKLSNCIKIASKYYYNRLAISFFSAVVLEQYLHINPCFEHPLLDLGCADGLFAKMLKETGIINSVDLSLDYSLNKHKLPESKDIVYGDAKNLPLKPGSFNSVLANCVIASVPVKTEEEVNKMLSEVSRILHDKGLFVLTIPTDMFNRNLIIPKLLNTLGLKGSSARYINWLERNVTHYQVYKKDRWLAKLEEAHFQIERISYFFTPYQGFWWNIFTLPIFSFWFKFSAGFKIKSLDKVMTSLINKLFHLILFKEPECKFDMAGFIIITSRKVNTV